MRRAGEESIRDAALNAHDAGGLSAAEVVQALTEVLRVWSGYAVRDAHGDKD